MPWGGVGVQEVADAAGEVVGEGEAPDLVVDDAGVDAAGGEGGHGAHEVVAVADDPAGAEDVVEGDGGDEGVAGGFGLPVDAEGAHRVGLGVRAGFGAVEDVVAGDVDEGDAVGGGDAGEGGDSGDVGGPGVFAAVGGFGGVDVGVGGGVDDGVVLAPAAGGAQLG